MLARARGGLGYGSGHGGGAAFRNDYSVSACGIGCAENRAQVMRIFHTIEHQHQRVQAALSSNDVVKIAILLGRGDRDHSLMRRGARHAIKVGPQQKTHGNACTTAVFDEPLQPNVMAFLRHADPLESPLASLERLGDRIDAVDVMHGVLVYRAATPHRRDATCYVSAGGDANVGAVVLSAKDVASSVSTAWPEEPRRCRQVPDAPCNPRAQTRRERFHRDQECRSPESA